MNYFTQYRGLKKENYILVIGRLVTNMGSMIYPVLTLILNQKLGMSAMQISLFIVCSGILILPASVIGGKLADKYNKKNIIIYCDLISVVFFIIAGFMPLSITSIIILLVASTFQNVEQPAYVSLIADITPTKDRERAYSLSYLGVNVGLVASPTIAGLLFENYLWLSFFINGLSILCSTILIFFFVNDITPVAQEEESDEYQASDDKASIWQIFRTNPLICFYTIVISFYYAAYSEWGYIIPLELGKLHGEEGALIFGTINSVNCITVVVATAVLTKIFEKVTKTLQTLVGVVFVLIGYVTFLLFLGKIPFYYLAIVLFTFGEILTSIVNNAYVSERIPASHRGRITGASNFLSNFLYGIIISFMGFLYDNNGSLPTWSLLFVIMSAVVVGCTYIVIRDKKVYPALYKR